MHRVFFAATAALFFTGSLHAMDRPVGYERFTALTVESGVFHEQTSQQIYQDFAVPLPLFGFVQHQKDKRLIDIEPHINANGSLRFSGVWIANKDDFEHDTWLMIDLTFGQVVAIHTNWGKNAIAIDIERYEIGGKLRFAVIYQRNLAKADWLVKFDASEASIRAEEARGFRVVDFDEYCTPVAGSDEFDCTFSFDAVMVKNTGTNEVDSYWTTLPTVGSVTPLEGFGFLLGGYQMFGLQATDIEFVQAPNHPIRGRVILVYSDRDFLLAANQSEMEITFSQMMFGRVVDLEGGPDATTPIPNLMTDQTWQTIMAGTPLGQ